MSCSVSSHIWTLVIPVLIFFVVGRSVVCGGDFALIKTVAGDTNHQFTKCELRARAAYEQRARERTRATREGAYANYATCPSEVVNPGPAPRAPLSGAVIGSQRHSFRKAKRNGGRRRRAGFLELLIFVASLRRKSFFALSVVLSI